MKDKYNRLKMAMGLIGTPPMSHLFTEARVCGGCQQTTEHDFFEVIIGKYIGVGAPWFVSPFLKRRSTKGKMPTDGVKGQVSLCPDCLRIEGEDQNGRIIVNLHGDSFLGNR